MTSEGLLDELGWRGILHGATPGLAERLRAGGPIAGHLRPLSLVGRLSGHLHAAVFSYRALPQRTVELATLVRGLFRSHQLQDVIHLVWDDRGEAGVAESALVRGVAWVGPITDVG